MQFSLVQGWIILLISILSSTDRIMFTKTAGINLLDNLVWNSFLPRGDSCCISKHWQIDRWPAAWWEILNLSSPGVSVQLNLDVAEHISSHWVCVWHHVCNESWLGDGACKEVWPMRAPFLDHVLCLVQSQTTCCQRWLQLGAVNKMCMTAEDLQRHFQCSVWY